MKRRPRPRPLRIAVVTGPTQAYHLGARDVRRVILRRLRRTDICIDCLQKALACANVR